MPLKDRPSPPPDPGESPQTSLLYASQSVPIAATVIGPCSNPAITFTLAPGLGTIDSTGLYTAPAAISAQQVVTVTATAQTTPPMSGSVSITLEPAPVTGLVSVNVTPPAATLYNGGIQQFAAAVANTSNSAVSWTMTPASGAGSISGSGLFTAPPTITMAQTVTITATSQADTTKSASATIALLPGAGAPSSATPFGLVLNLAVQSLCRRSDTAPTVTVGLDQTTILSPAGTAAVTVTGSVSNYSLANPGQALAFTWSETSGPATVQFASANAASTQVTFNTAGSYTLQLSVSDGILTTTVPTHVAVYPAADTNVTLSIKPSSSGPNAINTPLVLQIVSPSCSPVQLTVTGANSASGTVNIFNNNGTFTYRGQNPGQDTAVASCGGGVSNSVTITWITAPPIITSSPVTGQFFSADGSGVFNTIPSAQPVFASVFPNVNFNPAAGSVPGNTSGVANTTRPFTDIETDSLGNYQGTLPAQGNDYQAGVAGLYAFSAVFTGSFNVASPGVVTFTFSDDDSFVFGVGNGAARISGPQTNTPANTVFQNYPVIGGVNQRTSPVSNAVVVNFPAAGIYPYEVDYAKGGDSKLTLTMYANGAPIPSAAQLTLTPTSSTVPKVGQAMSLVLTATSGGTAIPNQVVTMTVTGVNPQTVQLTTDGTGTVAYIYEGSPLSAGKDQVRATAVANGVGLYSNVVTATWNTGVNLAPVVTAGDAQTIVLPNPAILSGTASDDGLPNNTLTVAWTQMSGPGTVTFDNSNQTVTSAHFSIAGTYVLQLSATDGALTSTSNVIIEVSGTTSWSTGWLASPLNNATITVPTPITLISGVTLTSGTLKIYPATNQAPVTILNPTTTGSGQIGALDPTLLNNGSYFVELDGTNSQNVTQANVIMVTIAGDYKPGRVTATITDLTIPAPGLPIQIQRTYDSLVRATSGDFGYGWNLGVSMQVDVSPSSDVTLTVNGRRRTFYFTPPPNPVFQIYYTPQYTPEPGLYGSLSATSDNCFGVLVHAGQLWQCAIADNDNVYQPNGYQYTDPSGRVYTMGPTGQIQSIQDLSGNTVTITSGGISSSNGISVPFVRDSNGRIAQITDTSGNRFLYAYDTNGNLTSVTYPAVPTPAQYQYDPTHLLTQETDRRGNIAGTSTYYVNGQLQSVTDAVSNTTQYVYNTATNTTTVTNPDNGTVVTVYDSYGMPLSVTDPLGRMTTNTYDGNHNLLTTVDPLQNTTTYTYDSNGFRTSIKDPLGNTTLATYNAFGGPTSLTDSMGNTIATVYDSQIHPTQLADALGQVASIAYDNAGNIVSFTDAAGSTTTNAFDAQGNLLTSTDPVSRTTTNTYDSFGNVLMTKDPRGNVTTYSYDLLSHLTQITDASGKITSYGYDGNGNRSSVLDPLQRLTTYIYDAKNRLTLTTYPDGTTSSTAYDWRDNPLTQLDQAGRTTKNVYDLAGQLTSSTSALGTPDASTVTYNYDSDRHPLTTTDALGNVTSYAYDSAGHMTSTTTPAGATTLTYDADGRPSTIVDANNQTTKYAYDARGGLTKTTYADGTTTKSTYDSYGRLLTSTDQAGKISTRAYDAAGQLLSITDPMSETTQFGYDPSGNQISRTDANVHTTTDDFDVLNRFLTRTYPAGGTAQSNLYDSAGNLGSTTDFNGNSTTFGYDSLDRLLQKKPDPSFNSGTVSFTYTTTGRRATMTDDSGSTTYTYDNLDRLLTKAGAAGTLTYSYDGNGNVKSLQSSNVNGASLSYIYDSLNRLMSVTDNRLPSGQGTTTYSYDAVSNLATATYPSGVTQTLGYDSVNRLTSSATPVRSFTYGRAATGHILSVSEGTGRNDGYGYDNIWRLVLHGVSGDPWRPQRHFELRAGPGRQHSFPWFHL